MQILPYSRNIYYYETDRMNVVSHTNYIRWMEEARVYFLNQIGMPYEKMEGAGYMMPVLGVKCKYHKSLTFGDNFLIYCYITEYNGFKMKITYEIRNKETNVLCAEAESLHCFTDNNMKPIRIIKKDPAIHTEFLKAMNVSYTK